MTMLWFGKATRIGVLALLATLIAGAAPAATRWSIDPAHTRVGFGIDAVGYPRTNGVFRKFDGRIDIDFARPELSHVVFRVDANSVDVGSDSFNDYLKSDGYLDSARHPEIDFTSRSVVQVDDKTVRVEGDLTLLGVTRPLSVNVTVQRDPSGKKLEFAAHARINRLEFGMNGGFPAVSGELDLDIATRAVAL